AIMFNDRIYISNHNSSSSYRSSYSSTASPLTSRKVYKSNSPVTSSERLNSSFNRGKDGIFRPKSLLSLATEIDFVSSSNSSYSSSSLPKSSPITIDSNPRIAQFRSHHREASVSRHA